VRGDLEDVVTVRELMEELAKLDPELDVSRDDSEYGAAMVTHGVLDSDGLTLNSGEPWPASGQRMAFSRYVAPPPLPVDPRPFRVKLDEAMDKAQYESMDLLGRDLFKER
jgi:hypothetical protein